MKLLKTYRPDSYVWIDWEYPLVIAAGVLRKSRSKSLHPYTLLARITQRPCKWRIDKLLKAMYEAT